MPRRPLSSYPPEIAAKMRADMAEAMRKAWAEREANGLGVRKNGSFQPVVQAKIRNSVKKLWKDGVYDDRENGMSGKSFSKHHLWTWGKHDFNVILSQLEEKQCRFCGETENLNAHHVDENHDNYLQSNLLWACVPCHLHEFHYEKNKRGGAFKHPFITIAKSYKFEYSHILPWHPGKCGKLHGHSGKLTIKVRGRINPFGMVQDFYDISQIAKPAVIDKLDHELLNDYIPNPTSENMLVYVWKKLERAELKGLYSIKFSETDSSSAILTKDDMIESFGWDNIKGKWKFVRKPIDQND